MPSYPHSAWGRLGELLVRRRIELDPRYSNRRIFTDERIPGRYRIVNALERGQRDNYEAGTLAAIESAYHLDPGAIARFLAGGELESGPPPTEPAAPVTSSGTVALPPLATAGEPDAEDAAEVTRAVVVAAIGPRFERQVWAEVHRHPEGTPARVIFKDPIEAALFERDAPELQRIRWIAALRSVDYQARRAG